MDPLARKEELLTTGPSSQRNRANEAQADPKVARGTTGEASNFSQLSNTIKHMYQELEDPAVNALTEKGNGEVTPLDSEVLKRIIAGQEDLAHHADRHRLLELEKYHWKGVHDHFGTSGPYTPRLSRTNRLWALGNRQMLLGNQAAVHHHEWGQKGFQALGILQQSPLRLKNTWINNPDGVLTFQGRALALVALNKEAPDRTPSLTALMGDRMDRSMRDFLGSTVRLPSSYMMSAMYLRSVYSTDQDTECRAQHIANTVCTLCFTRVLCCKADCFHCDQAVMLSVEGIIGPVDTWMEGSPLEIRDILYHDLVAHGTSPASSNSRFPIHRLPEHEVDRGTWVQNYPKRQVSSGVGANPTYNVTRHCHQCKSTHTSIGRKLAPTYFLPSEMTYSNIVNARDPGRSLPRMMFSFEEDEDVTGRLEPLARCPRSGTSWTRLIAEASSAEPGSALDDFVKIIKNSVRTINQWK